jgi:hypothetical protein
VVTSEWLSQVNYPSNTQRKWNRVKRCRTCDASVIWVETPRGSHVCLDAHPYSDGGQWARSHSGVAVKVDKKHGGLGPYRRHVCPEVKP